MGHDAELIDYWPKYRNGHYDFYNFPTEPTIKKVIKSIVDSAYKWKAYSKFNGFIKYHLNIKSRPYHLGSDIPDKYDIIICGSDQIWRYNFSGMSGFDYAYFAKYPSNSKVIKVSYAASMGDRDIDEIAKEKLSKLLENFDFISVRENSLLELVKPLTTKSLIKVLDPVFLLAEPEWRKMISTKANKKKYLLFYELLQSAEAENLAKKIAKERNLEIVQIRGINSKANRFGSVNLKSSAGPIDFVSLIAHSDYVVSTSYHGVAFAIIFQKPFSTLGFNHNSYRIKSLLETLGIQQCLIDKKSNDYPSDVDYTSVNIVLKELINDSLDFLNQGINSPSKHPLLLTR
jgi:polysaccharide pyruvyl transferase WcaK-like protein